MLLTNLEIKFKCKELDDNNKGNGIIAKHLFYFKSVLTFSAIEQAGDFVAGYTLLKQINESQIIELGRSLIKYSFIECKNRSDSKLILAKNSFFVDTVLQLKQGVPLLFIYYDEDSKIVPVDIRFLEQVVWLSNNEVLLLIAKGNGKFNLYYSNESVYELNAGPKPCCLKNLFDSV